MLKTTITALNPRPYGDPSFMLGDLRIEGDKACYASFHAEFVEVAGAHSTKAVDPSYQNRIDAVMEFDDGKPNRYETVPFEGRHWFVIIIPYQR